MARASHGPTHEPWWEEFAKAPPCSAPSGTTVTERDVRRFLGVFKLSQTLTETFSASSGVGSRGSLTLHLQRVKRQTTLRGGRVVEDSLRETAVVRDHLGQVHSARVSTFRDGQLAEEAAALYLPSGLAARGPPGSPTPSSLSSLGLAALRCSRDSAASGGSMGGGGGPGGDAAQGCQVVGYTLRGGVTTWGLLHDPATLGLPQQRPVTRTSIEGLLAPRWQAPGWRTPSASTHTASSQPAQSPPAALPVGRALPLTPAPCPGQTPLTCAGPPPGAPGGALQARWSR